VEGGQWFASNFGHRLPERRNSQRRASFRTLRLRRRRRGAAHGRAAKAIGDRPTFDSSVLLRVVLGQRNALEEWGRVTQGIASALAEVECLRTLDRLRLAQGFADEMIAEQREAVYRLLESNGDCGD